MTEIHTGFCAQITRDLVSRIINCSDEIDTVSGWIKQLKEFSAPSCEFNWFGLEFVNSTGSPRKRTGTCPEPMPIDIE